ncbi:serine/threonine protein kinase [Kitasatospora sp. GP30]|uniref:serine/threonine-protein kinase n=1 Tax=Kitasatospora sp. GP30 TaxID=3035084 RepID=UPI000C714B24|nr:serine/threonine protein kinase [Kitasatospora sp. GP30]MDH6139157.1 serine/threonine protein kinase [Kitasatospora sp. GP30]
MIDSTIAEPLGPDDPQEIGSFTVIGVLGVGGMGEVYLGASDRGYAAVKRVRPRLVSPDRFEREVGILYRVPFGVGPRVLASDGTAERPWFATEYVPGLTVDEAVRLRGPLPAGALWLLLAETAVQLRAVHTSGIVHRDVKPGNVMLVRDGVKLIDFGIARAADQAKLTRSGGGFGTQGFSAPEQQAGAEEVAAPADVYSLGALLLYAASGRTPGVVPDLEPLHTVDAELAAVLAPCLAADPGARPTAHELVKATRAQLPAPLPSWPPEVAARIAARRDFAATPVSKLETVPPPDLEPEPEPVPKSAARPGARRRLLVPAAAVIALGSVAAFLFSPSASPQGGAARPSGSSPVTTQLAAGTTQPPTASPSPTQAAPTAQSTPPTPADSAGAPQPAPPGSPGSPGTPGPRSTPGTPTSRSTSPAPAPVPNPALASSPAPSAAVPTPTSSSISGINGGDDPAQVKGSEADTDWVGNDAACSAWLDTDGAGGLSGVLNTSLGQTCVAELYRSDGVAYTFRASWGAARTSSLPNAGTTMWICVWNASAQSDEQCSPHFAMNGTTPVHQ